MKIIKRIIIILGILFGFILNAQNKPYKVLNFYGDNGFVHKSQESALKLVKDLGVKNEWEVTTTRDTSVFSLKKIMRFDVIIFNNNCGNRGKIFSESQQLAFQQYIRNGGGFVAIHCGGAIWKEGDSFQKWYEDLVGVSMINHPAVQPANLHIDNPAETITNHLPKVWKVKDEWHQFDRNPRENVTVLATLDENSYEGEPKMGGDHPFIWYQHFDGGRSFFSSLGHTKEIYADPQYQKMIEKGILWAAGKTENSKSLPITTGLLIDLNADQDVHLEDGNNVSLWKNQVKNNEIKNFSKRDKGRKIPGSGRPRLKLNDPKINGHNTIVFHRQELLNEQEDALDHLTNGSGYTWLSVMAVYEQVKGKPGINAFFGNLRNTNVDKKGQYEGFWGGLNLENQVWMSSRNALQNGPFNENSPQILASEPLKKMKYYLIMGRLGAGTTTVDMELFVNTTKPIGTKPFIVNKKGNPSKLSIGQERDATNHPGAESFDGEIARFLIFERPLSDSELQQMADYLKSYYGIKE